MNSTVTEKNTLPTLGPPSLTAKQCFQANLLIKISTNNSHHDITFNKIGADKPKTDF